MSFIWIGNLQNQNAMVLRKILTRQMVNNRKLIQNKYLLPLRCGNVIGFDSTVIHLAFILEHLFDTLTLFESLTADLSIMLNNMTCAY